MYDLYPDTFRFNSAPHPHAMLIGLSGWATAGKDSVGRVLAHLYGYQRVSFADNLKAFVRDVNPIVRADLDYLVGGYPQVPVARVTRSATLVEQHGDTVAKNEAEYRRLLQTTGDKARHYFGEDVWVNSAFRILEDGKHYVITDCRYQNEALSIKERGGLVLRVIRPGVGPINDHVSERDLDDWEFDGYIQNDGSLLDLEGEVQRVLGDLG